MQNIDDLKAVVRELRSQLGLSQTEFGRMVGKGLATIQRYETLVPPRGKALADLARFAESKGKFAIAGQFRRALRDELGPGERSFDPISQPVRSALEALFKNRGLPWVQMHLDTLVREAYKKGAKPVVAPGIDPASDPEVHRQVLRAILAELSSMDPETSALSDALMPFTLPDLSRKTK